MASPRLEAEDFRVIEPCVLYLPRRKASRRGLHGMIPRLREPVNETAQTRPAVAVQLVTRRQTNGCWQPGRRCYRTGEQG